MLERENSQEKPLGNRLILSTDGIFNSFQGEGQTIGKPASFLRLQLCNLECSFCDTPYTWNKTEKGIPYSVSQVKEMLDLSWEAKTKPRVVITGGEPLLQQRQLTTLIKELPKWDIEIETNGTILPNPELRGMAYNKKIQFNVSPKTENSGNALEKRYKPDILKTFDNFENTIFKFVVNKENDIDEIEKIVNECDLSAEKIIIMPEGTTTEAIRKHSRLIEPLVKEKGYRLLTRMQIELYGDKRRT
jgi:organic radical activating enzyme